MGEIIVCQRLVDLPVGFAHSNHSYGGHCTLEDGSSRKPVMICNDEMVGHFAIQALRFGVEADDKLIDFTGRNCFGG
jgi:hypothetical protein